MKRGNPNLDYILESWGGDEGWGKEDASVGDGEDENEDENGGDADAAAWWNDDTSLGGGDEDGYTVASLDAASDDEAQESSSWSSDTPAKQDFTTHFADASWEERQALQQMPEVKRFRPYMESSLRWSCTVEY